jgi:type VI protein secretion system component Hcp
MSFKVKMKVGGQELNVLDVSYQLKQETDATGRPSSITRGGKITFTVESTGSTMLFEWMCNNFERKDGTITFIKRDTDATLKELNFEEAYAVQFAENFNSTGDNPVTETLTISAKKISMGSGSYINEWTV